VAIGGVYDRPVPRSWTISMFVLTTCLLASIVIAALKLL
jgi:hypothetical protein